MLVCEVKFGKVRFDLQGFYEYFKIQNFYFIDHEGLIMKMQKKM